MTRVLLLAGTTEARELAALFSAAGISVVASLSGATESPVPLDVPTRVGGFGGAAGFVDYLRSERISAVVDATHPFARAITDRTAAVCKDLGMRHLILQRPEWRAGPGDVWHDFDAPADLERLIPPAATVFLATGRQTIPDFARMPGGRILVRVIDASTDPLPDPRWEYIIARPPFPAAQEQRLFADLGVDWLVTKNAGGAATAGKLSAARALGLPVAIQRRPPVPRAPLCRTPAEALSWVRGA